MSEQINKKTRSKRMSKIETEGIDFGTRDKPEALSEAIAFVQKGSGVKFEETVEIAVGLGIDPKKSDQNVRGVANMPAGTGRSVRIWAVVADGDEQAALDAGAIKAGSDDLIEEIKGGNIDFDVLVCIPAMMKNLSKVAKQLGPIGKMPNPKSGTVNADFAAAIVKISAGQVRFRSDKSGIVHAPVGRISFAADGLSENIESVLRELKRIKPANSKGIYLRYLTISTTMGKGVFVDISSYR